MRKHLGKPGAKSMPLAVVWMLDQIIDERPHLGWQKAIRRIEQSHGAYISECFESQSASTCTSFPTL